MASPYNQEARRKAVSRLVGVGTAVILLGAAVYLVVLQPRSLASSTQAASTSTVTSTSTLTSTLTLAASSSTSDQVIADPYSGYSSYTWLVFTQKISGTSYYFAKCGASVAIGASSCSAGQVYYGGRANAGGVDGTNASKVVQAAINTLSSGGVVFLQTGTYALGHGGLVIDLGVERGVSLIGASISGTTLTHSGSGDILDVRYSQASYHAGLYFTLESFTLAQSSGAGAIGLALAGTETPLTTVSGGLVEDVIVTTAGNGTLATGVKLTEASQNQFIGLTVSGAGIKIGIDVSAKSCSCDNLFEKLITVGSGMTTELWFESPAGNLNQVIGASLFGTNPTTAAVVIDGEFNVLTGLDVEGYGSSNTAIIINGNANTISRSDFEPSGGIGIQISSKAMYNILTGDSFAKLTAHAILDSGPYNEILTPYANPNQICITPGTPVLYQGLTLFLENDSSCSSTLTGTGLTNST